MDLTKPEKIKNDTDEFKEKVIDLKLSYNKVQEYLLNKQTCPYGSSSMDSNREMVVPLTFEELHFYTYKENIGQHGRMIKGPLDLDVLSKSLITIVERHNTLCTIYSEVRNKLQRSIIDPNWFKLIQINLRTIEISESEYVLQRYAKKDFADISTFKKPLFRATILIFANQSYVLLLSGHHLVFDGWSYRVLFNELSTLYRSFSKSSTNRLKPLTMQYPEFVHQQQLWYKSKEYRALENYWRNRLSGLSTIADIPSDRSRSKQEAVRIKSIPFKFPKALIEQARSEGVTPFITLLTIMGVNFAKYSKQNDIVIAYPKAGRIRSEYEGMIGNFADMLVFRLKLDFRLSFKELLIQAKKNALADYAHMQMPFLLLRQMLMRESERTHLNLFRFVLNMLPESHELSLPSLEVTRIEQNKIRDYSNQKIPRMEDSCEFIFTIRGEDLIINYDAALYDETTVNCMTKFLQVFIDTVVTSPDRTLTECFN